MAFRKCIQGESGGTFWFPAADGKLRAVVVPVEDENERSLRQQHYLRVAHGQLHIGGEGACFHESAAALGWALGSYEFARYKTAAPPPQRWCWPKPVKSKRAMTTAIAMCAVRDLVNTPAGDMGPAAFVGCGSRVVRKHGALPSAKSPGDDLLKKIFPPFTPWDAPAIVRRD